MDKCSTCLCLKKRVSNGEIWCEHRGKTHPRLRKCNKHMDKPKVTYDLLDWVGV